MKVADISSHQQIDNYDFFRNAFDAFYIKCTESDNYVNPLWKEQNRGLAGKPRAPYHFLGDRAPYSDQVSKFISEYKQAQWDWGPVLDSEFSGIAEEPTSVDIKNWIAEWRRQSGNYLIYVYLGVNAWKTVANPYQWADSGTRIIVAHYWQNNYDTAFQDAGVSHPNLDGVQYWNQGTAPGLTGIVDLNNFKQIVTSQPVAMKKTNLLAGMINDA